MIRALFSPWLLTIAVTVPLAGLTLWLAAQPEPQLLTWIPGLATLAILSRTASRENLKGF